MPDTDITLYALSTCIHCRNTKQLLADCDVNYDCIEVDKLSGKEREEVIAEVKKYNPSLSFPTLVVGDKVIVGFKKDDILKLLGKD